jgi:hypothetical protein
MHFVSKAIWWYFERVVKEIKLQLGQVSEICDMNCSPTKMPLLAKHIKNLMVLDELEIT